MFEFALKYLTDADYMLKHTNTDLIIVTVILLFIGVIAYLSAR